MREAEIRAAQAASAKRSALLFSQWEFLETRQRAFESVLKVSRLSDRIKWLVNPKVLIDHVDKVQLALLDEGKRKMEEAMAKPKLTIVGANGLK